MPPRVTLHSRTPRSILRWTLGDGVSLRAYETLTAEGSGCVSTRSTELTVVLEGELVVSFGPVGQHITIRPDEGCVVMQGTPHQCEAAPGTKMVVLDLFGRCGQGLQAGLFPRHLVSSRPLRTLSRWWGREWEIPSDELRAFVVMLDRPASTSLHLEHTHNTGKMLAVKAFLEQHYTESLNMAQLATDFGLERHYLIREFKKNLGFPPLSYTNFLRLEHFAWWTMTTRGRGSRTRGALDAGFGDYPTFCRRIRQAFGQPPSRLLSAERERADAL